MNTIINTIHFTRVKNDIYGNPRYVVHFLNFDNDYSMAHKKALSIGGKKYRAKHYGGGFVFTSYNLHDLSKKIIKIKNN